MNPLTVVILPLLVLIAAFYDLFTMRIPNALAGGIAVAFVVIALFAGLNLSTMGMHLIAGALVLAITFGLFAAGWIGGGDAKLAAAIAMWMGFELLLPYLLYAGVIGGVLTLALLMARRWALPGPLLQVGWIVKLHHPKTGIPYGIALALAALLIYPQTTIYKELVGRDIEQQVLLEELQSL